MQPAADRSEGDGSPLTRSAAAASPDLPTVRTDVFVVSEDAPGQWRVADRTQDMVSGPYPDEDSAVSVALEDVGQSARWEIHVLDQFGTLSNTYNSDEDATLLKVD